MLNVKQLSTEKHTLRNGATLLFTPIDTAPRLAISAFLPGGNLLEPIPGLSDLTDRLIMKGTRTRTQEQIAVEIDGMTLEVDTDTKRDYSAIHATLLEEDLEPSLALIADLFYNSTFDEWDREKQKIAGEVMMDLDSPKSRAADQFIRRMFHNTPYGVVGSTMLDHLPEMIDKEQGLAHYKRIFQPSNMIVSVAGNIALDKISRALESAFPPGAESPLIAPSETEDLLTNLQILEEDVVTFARDDSSQAHIYKGWLVPQIRHEDYAPLALMNTILGAAGLSSRLFLELRDKQGLAYTVRSTLESFRHRGFFYLYIGTEPKNKKKCLKGFIEECGKLMNDPVPAGELADGKRNMLGRRSVYLETAHQQANYIGSQYVLGRSLEEIEQFPERIEAVTAQDIQRVAQMYLSQPPVISVVGPSAIL